MKITQHTEDGNVIFSPETSSEADALSRFPGFFKTGLSFIAPPKPHVIYNLFQRVKKAFRKSTFKITRPVADLMNAEVKLKEIPESFHFFTPPLKHQLVALRWLYTFISGGLLLDPGLGKTKVVLDFIALMNFKKAGVICPKALLFVWEDEARMHRPDKTIYIVKSTDWEAEAPGIASADIVVINYNKAVTFLENLKTVGFDFLAIDEALIKDPASQRTQAITELGQGVRSKVLMSGTLINNTPLDLFAPVRFVEPSLVGLSFAKFCAEYAVYTEIDRGNDKKLPVVVGCRRVPEMRSILETVSIVMTKDEWLDLPPKSFIDIPVTMSDVQAAAYKFLQSNYVVQISGKTVEADNALTLAAKLFQISSGFAYINNDDSLLDLFAKSGNSRKKRETVYFPEQPKAKALTELVTGTLKGRRGIIWYNMSAELEIISKALDSAGISYLVIKGGEKDTGGKVRRFNVDPSVSWLVCQAKSVNYGITVLGKSAEDLEEMDIELPPGITPEVYTHIYYSLNFSLEVYLQQQDRSHRIGQKHACEYYRLITNAPIEHHIVRALHRKRNIRNEMLIDYIEKLKKDSLNVNVSDRPERSDNPNLSEQPDLPEPPEPAGLSDGDLGW